MRLPALALAWSAVTLLLATFGVSSCAQADANGCERNSDCDRAYCDAGKCKQDCVDATLDCPHGYACSAIGRCEDDRGGGGESSFGGSMSIGAGGSGVAGQGGTPAVGGGGGIAVGGAPGGNGGTGGQGTAGSGATGGSASGGAPNGGAPNGGAPNGGAPNGGGPGAGGVAGTSSMAGTSSTAGTTSNGGSSVAGTSSAGGDPFGGGGSTAAGKGELDTCGSDAECQAPLLCRADWKNGTSRCTRTCSSIGDCHGGRRCETIGGADVCVGGDVGRYCGAADDCNFACLLSQKYCTSKCNTGSDCPNGYGCEPVGSASTRVCVKAEAPCSASDASACIAAAACDMTLLVSSCTLACNGASDCPVRAAGLPPWSCAGGLCARPSGIYGPLPGGAAAEWYCDGSGNPITLCNDSLHIDFDNFSIPNPPSIDCNSGMTQPGMSGDKCVDSCTYEGGCAFSFTCVGVGNVGSARVGLCFPSGGKPTGSPCQSDVECEFSYCAMSRCSRDCTSDGLCPTGTTCQPAGGPPSEGKPYSRCQ